MRIAIVEDEAPQRRQLASHIMEAARQRGTAVELEEYACGEEIVKADTSALDLIVMDIDMPGMSGMEAAGVIRQRDQDVLIAFCTNLVARALDGYAVQALDFLVKPVSCARIGELLEKAERFKGLRRQRTLTLRAQDNVLIVPVGDILYAETYGRKLRLHTVRETVDLRMTIAALEKLLPERAFFRTHNAFLVALAHVRRINGLELEIAGDTLPISRHKKKEFVQALTDYLGEQL
ncbi:MAG: LytR/AlgR family response regulator transcription factor [Candidatus Ventricola sp.]